MPLDKSMAGATDLPWTISYVIRKRAQIDSFNELPKEKRPPDDYVWWKPPEEIDKWLDRVLDNTKKTKPDESVFIIDEDEIE